MTMNNVMHKLRRKNMNHYYMLIFCITLSVLLVSSYALMYFSPTVQNVLPMGGDSRKQAMMIFCIAVAGCAVFTTYASSLFFKYKSYEYGLFMALGEKKSQLKKVLIKELLLIIVSCCVAGLLASIPVSFGMWKILQFAIVDTKEMRYSIGIVGFIFGLIFCIFVALCIYITGVRFIKRSNIIEIIRDNRRSEQPKAVKHWYGVVGWVCVVMGLLGGYFVPVIFLRVFGYNISFIGNIIYAIALVGIYMIMLYAVGNCRKGGNIKKYYKEIISFNMMRFTGRQTVKNMSVIALLIGGGLFAAFYTPMTVSGLLTAIENSSVDYAFTYREGEDQITFDEIFALADVHEVDVALYNKTTSMSLIVDGYERDYNKNNKFIEHYIDRMQYGEFFSESEFNRVSGDNVHVNPGEYYTITTAGSSENIWTKWDDLSLITHPASADSIRVKYCGKVEYTSLVLNEGGKYIISDEDYRKMAEGVPSGNYNNYMLFNVANPEKTYDFAVALKEEIVNRSSKASAVVDGYDEYQEMRMAEEGKSYWEGEKELDLKTDNNELYAEWKYYPSFTVLDKQDLVKNMAVFLMLFIYVAIVCLVAVAVIAYTRSVTIGLDNRNLFLDLKKLGATNQYIERVIKKQLSKIFIYPTLVGSTAIFALDMIILYGNSGGSFDVGEVGTLGINLIIAGGVLIFMYVVYRLAFRKVKSLIK